VVGLWMLGGAALLLVSAEGQYWHEFHQLPFLPPFMLAFGIVAAPAFNGTFLARHVGGRTAGVVTALTLVALAGVSFAVSQVRPQLYRVTAEYAPANLFIHFGNVVQGLVPPESMVVTVDYLEAGGNSPMLLYFARRQGWSFDVFSISPAVIENLRVNHGAQYFAAVVRHDMERDRLAVMDYLAQFETIPTPPQADQLMLVDLRRRKAP